MKLTIACKAFAIAAAASLCACGPEKCRQPLDCDAVAKALKGPTLQELRVQAAEIQHPLLCPVKLEPDRGLSPDEIAVLAVVGNKSLRAARDERGLAAAQLLQAGILPNPTLALANAYPYKGPDHLKLYSMELGWEISALIAQGAKVRQAALHSQQVDLDVAWQEWQVAESAKTSAWKVLSLQSQLEIASEIDREQAESLATVKKAFDLQLKTAADVSAAQTTAVEAHSTVLEVRKDLAKERLTLNRLLGLPDSDTVPLRNEDLPAVENLPRAAELQNCLEVRRLDLLALRRGYESQQAAVRVAVLGRFPKTALGGTLEPRHCRSLYRRL